MEFASLVTAPEAIAALAAGVLDQDAPHGLGRGGEEVAAAVPAGVLVSDESEVGLVDQGGRLERLAGLLVGQLLDRKLPELVVDQREQFGRPGLSPVDL